VILNYPANPTGRTYAPEELEKLAEVARDNSVVLLSDEIYGELHHEGRHVSIARYYPEGTIVSSGLSKWCGAGGWRLGTFLFPPELRWLLDAMAAAASETYTSTSAPIQYAAVRAFAGGPAIERYLADSRRVLAALGRWSALRLQDAGARCPMPQGAFYLFPDFSDLRGRLAARGIEDSPGLCRQLLEDTGVAILPGSEFGRPTSELTARLAYVNFDGEAVLAALAEREDGPLDEGFLRTHCPQTLEAIERICAWMAG
jgi:aspartate aminotransferase